MEDGQHRRVFYGDNAITRGMEDHYRAPKVHHQALDLQRRPQTHQIQIRMAAVNIYDISSEIQDDIARLLVVHTEGCIYADLDVYLKSTAHKMPPTPRISSNILPNIKYPRPKQSLLYG